MNLQTKLNNMGKQFESHLLLPEGLKQIYSNCGVDLHRFNGNGSWNLPMSGHFFIDTKGIIKSMEVHPDYTQRPDPSEIIENLSLL